MPKDKSRKIKLTPIDEYDYQPIVNRFLSMQVDTEQYNCADIRIDDLKGFDPEKLKHLLTERGYEIDSIYPVDPNYRNFYSNYKIEFVVSLDHFIRTITNKLNEMFDRYESGSNGCVFHIRIPKYLIYKIPDNFTETIKSKINWSEYINTIDVDFVNQELVFTLNNPMEITHNNFRENMKSNIDAAIESGVKNVHFDVDINYIDDMLDAIKKFIYFIKTFRYDKQKEKFYIVFEANNGVEEPDDE